MAHTKELKAGALIQARMSSSRLPGKVLAPVEGRPLLAYLVERLHRLGPGWTVAVATSREASDDPVAAFCEGMGVPCWRGPLDDVALRLLECARHLGLDAFARVCADSPLLDVDLLRRGLALLHAASPGDSEGPADLVTNCLPKHFPAGQSVEVVRTASLERAYARFSEPGHHEHVTRYFYQHPGEFSIRAIVAGRDYSGAHLAVDQPRDLERVRAMVRRMDRPHWEYGLEELMALYEGAEEAP
uniref:Acylneuraminate cytidylyltransferase n=1 Tax=Fundidesulfovibrio putealis TaxID=270496 RepID=A0A7C4AGP0_9BACT